MDIRLNSAEASHREARTRYQQARKDLQRVKVLFEKELVTQKEYDDAITEEGALRQRFIQLQTEIQQVRDQLNKSRIVAPFNGWITQEFTEVGQWVSAGGQVVEMVDLSRVQVEVPLPERYVKDIRVNDPVAAVIDGLPTLQAQGRVFSVVAQADRAARTFPIKVELPQSRFDDQEWDGFPCDITGWRSLRGVSHSQRCPGIAGWTRVCLSCQ